MANSRYYPELDGLRAIAVSIVVFYHAFPKLLPSGFVGVDLFFVISGFLITGIIIESASKHQFSIWDFYYRRVRRIFPALLTVLLFTIVCAWFALSASELKTLGKHLFSSAFYFQNLNLLQESGYFDASSEKKPLVHLWSLSLEEQFYLFWPLILALSIRKKWNTLAIAGVICTVSFVLNLAGMSHHPSSVFYHLHTRLWELMLGAILAIHRAKYPEQWNAQAPRKTKVLSLAAISIFVAGLIYLDPSKPFPSWTALMPLFFACAAIFVGTRSFLGSWLSDRRLVYIGLISYPLYLWHWPILSLLHILSPQYQHNPTHFYVSRSIALAAATLLAVLTYEVLEKKLRTISGESKKGIAVFAILLVGLVQLGVAGRMIETREGLPDRSVAKKFKPMELGHVTDLLACSFSLPGVEWCKVVGNEAKLDVAIIGDSHALALIDGLAETLKEKGINAIAFGTGRTLGLWGVGTRVPGPFSFNGVRNLDKAFEWIAEKKVPRVILVSQAPGLFAQGAIIDWPTPLTNDPGKVFEDGLKRTVARLSQFSKVSLLLDNPSFPFDPLEVCTLRPVTFYKTQELTPCAVKKNDVLTLQKKYRDLIGSVLKTDPRLQLIDSLDALCDENLCFAKHGEQFLYSDTNHLTQIGLRRLAPRILGVF